MGIQQSISKFFIFCRDKITYLAIQGIVWLPLKFAPTLMASKTFDMVESSHGWTSSARSNYQFQTLWTWPKAIIIMTTKTSKAKIWFVLISNSILSTNGFIKRVIDHSLWIHLMVVVEPGPQGYPGGNPELRIWWGHWRRRGGVADFLFGVTSVWDGTAKDEVSVDSLKMVNAFNGCNGLQIKWFFLTDKENWLKVA